MCFLALFPNGIERQIGRQSLRIHDTVQDGRFARTERTLKGGRKVLSAHNTLAVSPKVSSKRREVGISQARCRDPPWIVTFLMHADCTGFNTCDVTGELASKAFMRWGREKQNAVSKYPVAVSNQSQRAA